MKKLRFLAIIIAAALVVSSGAASFAATADDEGRGTDQIMQEQQYFEFWNNAISTNNLPDLGQYQVTDETSDTNANPEGQRIQGGPRNDVVYQVVTQEELTPTPTIEPRAGYTDVDPNQGIQWAPSNPNPNEPTPAPTETPEPTPTEEPAPTTDPNPVPTQEPVTPGQQPTPIPTPVPQQIYVRPDPKGPVLVAPISQEPTKVVYDVGLEVGRLAHFTPTNATNDTKKSSDTNIINDPRSAVGSFSGTDHEARANNPGDATITFGNSSLNFTEVWNVHVYCRPLDFERTQYVVESSEDKDTYITLYLKYFEYEFEYAYDFKYTTSNKKVAYLAGGDLFSTFARFCIPKGAEGATVLTVQDKYGNSESAVLIVKSGAKKAETPTVTPEVTPDPGKPAEPEKEKITGSQFKKLVKAAELDCEAVSKKGKIVLTWDVFDDELTDAGLGGIEGYQIQISTDKGKTWKTKKTIKKAGTRKWTFKAGKKGKTYHFRIRGYKVFEDNGKKYYTGWQAGLKAKFKK